MPHAGTSGIEEWELGRGRKWEQRSGEQGGSTEIRAGFHSGSCPVPPAALDLSQDFRAGVSSPYMRPLVNA